MTLEALIEDCKLALDEGRSYISLVLPASRQGSGDSIHLLPNRRGPLGQVQCVNRKGETVALFNPKRILKYIETNQ